MKLVNWTDKEGRMHRSAIPNSAEPSMAPHGVPYGPPELDQLDWEALKLEINNALARHGLYTWDDVQRDPNGVGIALSIFKRHLIVLYRDDWNKPKPIESVGKG
jgi:hypothetical protein